MSFDISLPRFVGSGDTLSGKFALRFNEPVGKVNLRQKIGSYWTSTTVDAQTNDKPLQQTLILNNLPPGEVSVSLELDYAGTNITRDFTLVVRDPSYPMSQMSSVKLERSLLSGRAINVDPIDLSAFRNVDHAQLIWSLSPLPGAAMSQVTAALDRYPYGCLEQTSSGTRGVLAVAKLSGASPSIKEKINHGVKRILAKQKSNGSFGYWDQNSNIEPQYLAYATETLIQSLPYVKDKRPVEESIKKALLYLDGQNFEDTWTAIYTLGVLAKSGYEVTGRSRYAIDEQLKQDLSKKRSLGQKLDLLAAGYWLAVSIRDEKRADKLANQIQVVLSEAESFSSRKWLPTSSGWFDPSENISRRTKIGQWHPSSGVLLAALSSTNLHKPVKKLRALALETLASQTWRSTLDNANLGALLQAQSANLAGVEFTINGRVVHRDTPLDIALAKSGFKVKHSYDGALYLNAEVTGRRNTKGQVDNGFTVKKVWFDKDGHLANAHTKMLHAKQGDIFTVVVIFKATDDLGHGNLMLTDLLPSGFEIEERTGIETIQALKAMASVTPRWSQSMDDRYTANFSANWFKGKEAMVYYQVRATYPGDVQLPDAHVEFMYRPEINGRSNVGQAKIAVR